MQSSIKSELHELGRIDDAKNSYLESLKILDNMGSGAHSHIQEDRAMVLMNLANTFLSTGEYDQSERLLDAAQSSLSVPHLKSRIDLDRIRLAVLATASELNDFRADSRDWLRSSSELGARAVAELAPSNATPWGEMRKYFRRFHQNWLSWCLVAPERFEMIPEVFSAVQGREMVTRFLEQITEYGPAVIGGAILGHSSGDIVLSRAA